MKSPVLIIPFLLLFFLSLTLSAQTNTVQKKAGFGGPSFVNTAIADNWAFEAGGVGAGFLNQQFYLGGGGFGLSQKADDNEYDMGYGGLMLGYLWQGSGKTALNLYVLGGYGGISETSAENQKTSDNLWVVRPTVEVDFLLAPWLRLGIGGGYRWVSGVNIPSLDNSDLSAPFSSITFRFGN